MPKQIKHSNFAQQCEPWVARLTPLTEGEDMCRPARLHLLLLALWAFEAKIGRLPKAGSLQDAEEVVRIAKETWASSFENASKEGSSAPDSFEWSILGDPDTSVGDDKADKATPAGTAFTSSFEQLAMTLSLGAEGKLNAMAAIFGGLVGQEVLKACSAKFTPLQQWVHIDAAASLPRLWSREVRNMPSSSRPQATLSLAFSLQCFLSSQFLNCFYLGWCPAFATRSCPLSIGPPTGSLQRPGQGAWASGTGCARESSPPHGGHWCLRLRADEKLCDDRRRMWRRCSSCSSYGQGY